MTDAQRDWIDRASYRDLLTVRRFMPTDHPSASIWRGEAGAYLDTALITAAGKLTPAGRVRISKQVGWIQSKPIMALINSVPR